MSASDALGRQWKITETPYGGGADIEAHDKGDVVGTLSYWQHSSGGLGVDHLEVAKTHRRQGVATALYAHLHEQHPDKVVLHDMPNMTDDAKALGDRLAEKWPDKHVFTRL